MRLDSDARHPLTWHGTMTADPTTATIALEVDEVVYAMAWDGAASESLAGWLRSAQTADMFCVASRGVEVLAGSVERCLVDRLEANENPFAAALSGELQ